VADFLFEKEAIPAFILKESYDLLQKEGMSFYSPEETPYKELPPVLLRSPFGKGTLISPKRDWNSILIPFWPPEHEHKLFKEKLISQIVSSLINGAGRGAKYISSAEQRFHLFAKMDTFNYRIIRELSSLVDVTELFIFDEGLSFCFGFNADFEYSFFSSQHLKQDDKRLNGTLKEWDDYFVRNFGQDLPEFSLHEKAFETILRPSIPRPMAEYNRIKTKQN